MAVNMNIKMHVSTQVTDTHISLGFQRQQRHKGVSKNTWTKL